MPKRLIIPKLCGLELDVPIKDGDYQDFVFYKLFEKMVDEDYCFSW